MNTKKGVLAIIAVLGIGIMLVLVAGAIHGDNGKGFGGKEFAKMNTTYTPCMNDTAVVTCKENTNFSATEMLNCVKEAMMTCREKLNLTVNATRARFDMKNCSMGAKGNFSACMKNCLMGTRNFIEGMGFNATGPRFDMKNCLMGAKGNFSACMKNCSIGAEGDFSARGMRAGPGSYMKNCLMGAGGKFSPGAGPHPPRFNPGAGENFGKRHGF